MTVEIKKVITRDIALEFKNATSVNIFYIDINNNLQHSQSPRNKFTCSKITYRYTKYTYMHLFFFLILIYFNNILSK